LAVVWGYQPLPLPSFGVIARKDYRTGEWSEKPVHVTNGAPRLRGDAVVDLYFTPCLFSEPRRVKRAALTGRWLFADLDAVNPADLDLAPTLAWETSPGRFQCVWLLDRPLGPAALEALNQRVTYHVGADRGAWDLARVLRLPGSISTKHGEPFPVALLPGPRPVHRYEDVAALVRHVTVPGTGAVDAALPPSLPDAQEVYERHRAVLPWEARKLLNTRTLVVGDDRSRSLWKLERLLLAAGLTEAETLVLARESVWNKWRGQSRELAALWRDVQRASVVVAGAQTAATKGADK
jgi:hypothetical protein